MSFRAGLLVAVLFAGCGDGGNADAAGLSSGDASLDAGTDAPAVFAPEASADGRPGRPTPVCGVCGDYAAPTVAGAIALGRLDEASGLAASRAHEGVFYSHNDRGNDPEVFALSASGAHLGRFLLAGAPAGDLEDLALGPCERGTCIYLADTGNNRADRTEFALYRIPEPDVEVDDEPRGEVVPWERFPLRYEDGPHDVEAMLVDPASGQVYLVTKPGSGPSSVYRLPLPLVRDELAIARKWMTLPVPRAGDGQATGAAAHPCAPRFLLRTYRSLYEFRAPENARFEDAFKAMPAKLAVADETLGEAVGYRADGRGFVTVSEGARSPLHASGCAD